MPIIVNGHNILNPSIPNIKLKRVMVGDKQVFPYGEAWFDWPHYTETRYNDSVDVAGMGRITEDRTAYEGYAPLFASGYSPNFTNPWWGTVISDENYIFCISTPQNQPASYRITGSVDVINSYVGLSGNPRIHLRSIMTYKYGTTSISAESTILLSSDIPSGVWVTIPIDTTITTTYGYSQKLYPFVYSVYNANSVYFPFRFANVRIGIKRVYL